jgi:DNA (cytosine-5)-methyltransferase 1
MRTHLDLFSGIGGFALAAEWAGFETVAFCEIDPYCQKVLRKHWPHVPIHDDIRTLAGESVGSVDLLTGGFPCQPFSVAGKRRGTADDRNLWPEMARVVAECRPRWVLGENTPGFIGMALDDCLADLEGIGYEAWPVVVPACGVGAWHRRERVWIVAHAGSERRQQVAGSAHGDEAAHEGRTPEHDHVAQRHGQVAPHAHVEGEPVVAGDGDAGRGQLGARVDPDAQMRRLRRGSASGRAGLTTQLHENVSDSAGAGQPDPRGSGTNAWTPGRTAPRDDGWWDVEPNVGRVAHGVPHRVDRLRGLGNAIVPHVAFEIIRHMT